MPFRVSSKSGRRSSRASTERAVLFAVLLGTGCFHPQSYDDPLPVDGTFDRRTPTAAEQERCRLAVEYSKAKNGYAVLMLQDDRVVCEDYHGDTTAQTPHHLFSGTKSFSCAVAIALAEEGKLTLDDVVADTLTEWKSDPRKSQITVRQLLSFTSGLSSDELGLSLDGLVQHPSVGDKYATAAAQPAGTDPGTYYQYSSTHLLAFGAYLKRKTGEDPLDLIASRVLSKIGLRTSGWIRDPAGNPALPYGAFTNVREWAKFGSLLIHDGVWRGERVLSAERLAECRRGSSVMPAYGLTFWLNAGVAPGLQAAADTPMKKVERERVLYGDGPDDLYAAGGAHNGRLYVVPSRGLLVLRQGGSDESWSDHAFLARALDGVAR